MDLIKGVELERQAVAAVVSALEGFPLVVRTKALQRVLDYYTEHPEPKAEENQEKTAEREDISGRERAPSVSFRDSCAGRRTSSKINKLITAVGYLEENSGTPVTLDQVMDLFDEQRWPADRENLKETCWELSGDRYGYFDSVKNGDQLLLSEDGRRYLASLRRKNRKKKR